MSRKVLVIDDEFDFVDAIRMRLEANGYEVIGAHNGLEGVEKARHELPGLILLDLVMPKSNGFETLSKLKSDPQVSRIPVVIITAKSDTEYVFDAGKLGADDFIIKPVSMEGVLDLVRTYVP